MLLARITDTIQVLEKKFKTSRSKLNKKNVAKGSAFLMLAMLGFSANPVFAISQQEAQAKINQINSQINQIDNSLAANRQQQQTLQGIIDGINAQINAIQLQLTATQAQIDLTNTQIADTNAQIAQTQADLVDQRKIMAEYLKTMYMNGQTSTVELIAKSNSFSDFVDQDQYMTTMQEKVKSVEDKIAKLENDLKQKEKNLEADQAKNIQLQAQQQAQQAAVVAQQNYENSLLANAQAAANSLSSQKDALFAQKAQLSMAFNETVAVGGGSSYPYGNPPPAGRIDAPDAYGYLIGECTSYAAWKRASVGRPVPRAMGNGGQWASAAAARGMSVDRNPRAGDVMVFPYIGGYGHVAYVEAVYGNGTVLISEYNWTPYRYDQRVVNPYNYSALFIH